MLKRVGFGLMGGLLLAVIGYAQTAQTYKGEIMDSACAKSGSHAAMIKGTNMTAKECTIACVKKGAKYVLYNPATKTTYQLSDQTKPEQFAGEKVNVMGTLDKATKTITVSEIKTAT